MRVARPDRPDPRRPAPAPAPAGRQGCAGAPGSAGGADVRCARSPVGGRHACGACAAALTRSLGRGTIHAHWPLHIETRRTAALTLRLTLGEIRLSTQGRGKVPNGVILNIPVAPLTRHSSPVAISSASARWLHSTHEPS